MRNLHELDSFRISDERVREAYGWTGDETCGAFRLQLHREGPTFLVIASNDKGWDHLSVSLRERCPGWEEMDRIKRIFFKPDEVAMQLHLPVTDHINCHPHTLHIWRPHGTKRAIPLPPKEMV